MRVIKLLLENVKDGNLEVKMDDGSYVVTEIVGSKVHYQVTKDTESPTVTIDLILNGEVIDSRGVPFPTQEQPRIKDRLENDLTTTGKDLIQLFKKEGIDPLGLGDFVRSKTRNWNEDEWKKDYRTLNVRLNVKVNLTETEIRK